MWEIRQRDYATEAPSAVCVPADGKHPLLEAATRLQAAEEATAKEAATKAAEADAKKKAPSAAPAAPPPPSDPLGADDPLGAMAVNADPLGAVAVDDDPLSGGGGGGGGGSGGGGGGGGSVADGSSVLLVGGTFAGEQGGEEVLSSRAASWRDKRAMIIKEYAAVGQLKVSSDLLEADGVAATALGSNIDDAGPSGEKKVALDSKTRRRLEQLQEQEADGKSVR
jgi:hypothetical protein